VCVSSTLLNEADAMFVSAKQTVTTMTNAVDSRHGNNSRIGVDFAAMI